MVRERPDRTRTAIVDHYRLNYDSGCWGQRYRPMVRLVEAIAASPYAPALFARWTSPCRMDHRQGQLDLGRTRVLVRRHQVLAVSYVPEEDWFPFEYHEAARGPRPWATACAVAEGLAELEWGLTRRLRWFRTCRQSA